MGEKREISKTLVMNHNVRKRKERLDEPSSDGSGTWLTLSGWGG